jgi:putative DNA primase/helicase
MEDLDKLAEIERLSKLPLLEFKAVQEEAAKRLGLTPEELFEQVREKITPATVADLAKLSPLEYDQVREANAQALGVRQSTLDGEVERARHGGEAHDPAEAAAALAPPPPEPWPDAVDGNTLLNDIHKFISRFVATTRHQLDALTLWIVFTYLLDIADYSTRLAISSPTMRCGKSLVLSVLALLVRRPLPFSNISPAAVFRAIDLEHPALLIDEVDTMSLKSGKSERAEELRGIPNSGHTPTNAFVIRTEKVGDAHVPRKFSTWTAIAMAGIRGMPRTWEDRSIEIKMKRKPPGRKVEKLNRRRNRRAFEQARELSRKIERWAGDHRAALAEAVPKLPNIDDRAQDNWELPIAIANECKGTWPRRAWTAAEVLSEGRADSADVGEQLLADIRQIFKARKEDQIASTALCDALVALESGEWNEYGRQGKPITKLQVARLLKPFGIMPGLIWLSAIQQPARGYKFEQFKEVFVSYPPPPEPKPEPPEPPPQHADIPDPKRQDVRPAGGVGESDDFQSVRESPPNTLKNDTSPYGERRPNDLTDPSHGSGGESMKTGSDDPPDGATYEPGRNGTPPTIPEWLKRCLRRLEHPDDEIARMKLLRAHEIIRAQLRDQGYTDAEIHEFTPAQKEAAIFGADPNEEEIFKP